LDFRVSPTAFFQVNTPGAERLYGVVCEAALQGTSGGIGVLDVCCGTGTIGLAVAQDPRCSRLIGIEWCSEAVADARHNALRNGLAEKSVFFAGKAEDAIAAQLDRLLATPDVPGGVVAVLDPPRVGIEPSVCEVACG